jgi:hypothetical protein
VYSSTGQLTDTQMRVDYEDKDGRVVEQEFRVEKKIDPGQTDRTTKGTITMRIIGD